MGNLGSYIYYEGCRPSYLPASDEEPTFKPNEGFQGKRKERVSKISEKEMRASRIIPDARDYCAHLLPELFKCRRDKAPFFGLCKPLLHNYHNCQMEDYVLRLKEYEREKRLRIRKLKLEGKPLA